MDTNPADNPNPTPRPDADGAPSPLRAKPILDENGNLCGIEFLDPVPLLAEFDDVAICDPAELAKITRPPQP